MITTLAPDWRETTVRRVLRLLDRPAGSELGVITAYRDGTVTLRSNRREDGYTFSETENGYQEIRPGDLVFHALDGFAGAVGVSDSHGNGSPVYHVCEPVAGDDPAYLARLLRHLGTSGFLTTQAPNVRERSVDFRNWSTFARVPLVLPPVDEQRSIADYLDRETARIDTLIEDQRRLIEMLRERRSAVITHAATRGLDDVQLVDSHNLYLGDVPAHWTVSRFSREIDVNGGQVDPTEEPWTEMVLVAPNHIQSGTGRIIGRETAREQGADSGKYVADAGQILYSKIRPALNKVAVAVEDCLTSADMYAMSSRRDDDHRYLMYFMLAHPFHAFVTLASLRVKMPKINRDELGEAPLLRPPVDEQRRIAAYLDEQTMKIDTLIAQTERFIELARERRSALIAAAVTGEIDVREVA